MIAKGGQRDAKSDARLSWLFKSSSTGDREVRVSYVEVL